MTRKTKLVASTAAAVAAAVLVAVPLMAATSVTNVASGTLGERVHIMTHPLQESRVVVANINLPEKGDIVNWHTHPGPAIVVVTGGGTLTLVHEDCARTEYETGEAFIAPPHFHTARNLSDGPVVARATFIIPVDKPPTILADAETTAALDAKCGF